MIVSVGAAGAATPDLPGWAEDLLALNASTGLIEWAPVLLFAAGLVWLSYATRPDATETLNERNEREIEEARR